VSRSSWSHKVKNEWSTNWKPDQMIEMVNNITLLRWQPLGSWDLIKIGWHCGSTVMDKSVIIGSWVVIYCWWWQSSFTCAGDQISCYFCSNTTWSSIEMTAEESPQLRTTTIITSLFIDFANNWVNHNPVHLERFHG
jgi:hypothetical protein